MDPELRKRKMDFLVGISLMAFFHVIFFAALYYAREKGIHEIFFSDLLLMVLPFLLAFLGYFTVLRRTGFMRDQSIKSKILAAAVSFLLAFFSFWIALIVSISTWGS